MKVRVDPDLCVGHGRCYALAPDVFAPDDFGHCEILVTDVDGELADAGARRCGELPRARDHRRALRRSRGRPRLRRQARDRHRCRLGHGRGDGARCSSSSGPRCTPIDVKQPDTAGLASFSECDLRDPRQIEATVAKIGSVVNMLFNCAGLPNTFPDLDVMLVNFCGLRHLTEQVIPNMLEGADSAIASIASTAGIGWMANLELLGPLLATPDFARRAAWCEEHPAALANAYGLSKEAINAYTAFRSFPLAAQGIRINCLNPGPTDTPMMPDSRRPWARSTWTRSRCRSAGTRSPRNRRGRSCS